MSTVPPTSLTTARAQINRAAARGSSSAMLIPVTERHTLIVPRRHVQDYFALTSEELLACDDLLRQARELVLASDPSVEWFNVGANVGEVAGQTIFHFHLIPRRSGDVENPRGGVRHLIPGKGAY